MTTDDRHEAKRAAMAELQRMSKARGGKISPEELVEAARDPGSPLHDFFEWDDAEAAERYRLVQARTLLRMCRLEVTVHKRKMELPYYVRDPEADSDAQGYVETGRLPSQEELARDVLVSEFKRAATQLRRARQLAVFFQMELEVSDLIETIVGLQMRVEQTGAPLS